MHIEDKTRTVHRIFAVAKMTAIQIPLYTGSWEIENEVRDERCFFGVFFLQTLSQQTTVYKAIQALVQ